MEELEPLLSFVRRPRVEAKLAAAALAAEQHFAAHAAAGVRRQALEAEADLEWGAHHVRSLWLVSHRALRRAGFRQHPDSLAVLLAWRGAGLVLLRPPGERRSLALVPWSQPVGDGVHHVVVPAGTPYDTLADASAWHLLAFQTSAASQLERLEPADDGWVRFPEETQTS